jgi:hypothetical protein
LSLASRIAPGSGGPAGGRGRALDDAHDVALFHDEDLFAVKLDFRARPFSKQDPVSDLEIKAP